MVSVRLNQSRYVRLNKLGFSTSTLHKSILMFLKALFNVMLREFGVKGVRVQEVVSLDEEMMAFLKYGGPHSDFSATPSFFASC